MVIEFIVDSFVTMILAVFNLLPTIPATPQAVIDGGQWAIDLIVGSVSLLRMVFSTPLLIAMLAIGGGIVAFEAVYHIVMWVLKKIPMAAIS